MTDTAPPELDVGVVPPPSAPAAPRAQAADDAPASDAPLSTSVLLLYGLPAVGAGYMFMLISIFLMKFATDVLLIAPAAMGVIFMAGRVWDAVTDPVAGYLSDRTNTRFGRRRPWILASAIPASLGFLALWYVPAGASDGVRIAWIAAGVMLFYTGMTALTVPHNSLGAELSTQYHERTKVFGFRQVGFYVGSFVSIGLMFLLTSRDDVVSLARSQGVAAALALAVLVGVMAWRLRERPEYQGRGGERPFAAFADVWRNPHARLLLIVFFIESIGGAVIGVLTIYFSEYVLKTPQLTPVYIGAYFVAASLSIPLWMPLSRRFGKKPLWFFSMMGTGIGFGATFLLQPGMTVEFIVVAALLGLVAGCGNIVGPSIQADVIDYDDYRTGERKEGAYFAAWNFVYKSATGITMGITGFALQAAGFEPNVEQTESTQLAIRSLYALFPLSCYAIGSLLFLRFSLNESEYAEVRRALDERARG